MPQLIPLLGTADCGLSAIVDDDMYEELSQYRWRSGHGYAVRTMKISRGRYKAFGLHNHVLPPKRGFFIDHIDHNILNNQRSNLRYATSRENSRNTRTRSDNKSGFKGVSWLHRDQVWTVWICVDGRNRYVGSFRDKVEAAQAYNVKAKKFFGEFAWLNPIPGIAAD